MRINQFAPMRHRLSNLLTRGLWPFTPDPAPGGVIRWHDPGSEMAIWLSGNSRHELAHLRRCASKRPFVVIALDTGGLSLDEAVHRGWTLEQLGLALDTVEKHPEQGTLTLLPHALWTMLGEQDLHTAQGWAIISGPPDATTYLAALDPSGGTGGRCTDRDWLHALLAHALTLLPFMLLPSGWLGWRIGLILVGLLLGAVVAVAADRALLLRSGYIARHGAALIAGAMILLTSLVMQLAIAATAGLLICATLLAVWLSGLLTHARQPASRKVTRNSGRRSVDRPAHTGA